MHRWRVQRVLMRRLSTKKPTESYVDSLKILSSLIPHIWPDKRVNKDASSIKSRVVASISLLLGAKLINVQVPFLFKDMVDSFQVTSTSSMVNNISALTTVPTEIIVSTPIALVLAYGIARTTSAGFSELRNSIFSTVANGAIRQVAIDTFRHLHNLDMQFHLNRNTGELSRIIDRGARSINFALTQMIFNVIPTALEVSLVSGILAYNLGSQYAIVAVSTVGIYTYFTVTVSNWRVQVRKNMNKEETAASGKIVDSLLNYETVKLFNNETHEINRYDESLKGFQQVCIQAISFSHPFSHSRAHVGFYLNTNITIIFKFWSKFNLFIWVNRHDVHDSK